MENKMTTTAYQLNGKETSLARMLSISQEELESETERARMHEMLSQARNSLGKLTAALKLRFLERDDVIDGIAAALVAREHVLLLGDPGTSKSALTVAFCDALGGEFFSTLCNRFQTPDEVFGALSLKAMQEDRTVRITAGRLPEADVAFIDEVFKGSSAMLNSLLRALNEREWEQDGKRLKLPLRLVVAASNELPDESDGLSAFHDRLLVRFWVKRLQDDGNAQSVIFDEVPPQWPMPTVTMAEIDMLSAESKLVEFSDDAKQAVMQIRSKLVEKQVRVSDRRWHKAAKLLRAEAAIHGRARVTSAGLTMLESCLWERTEQIAIVREVVRAHVASWIKTTRDAHAALDEQSTRISAAARKGGTKEEALKQLGRASDSLFDLSGQMAQLVVDTPEATSDAAKVNERIGKIKSEIQSAMRGLGFG